MLGTHGSYIDDLNATVKSEDITAGEAVGLIETHADDSLIALHIHRHEEIKIDDPNLMVNKTWMALYLTADRLVACVGKIDKGFRLYYIKLEAIIERARRDNEMLRIESSLGRWCRARAIREYIDDDRLYHKKSDPGELMNALLRVRS